jgi:hypothetical protein
MHYYMSLILLRITEDILATARPRAKLINDSNLIHEMKK